MAANSRSESPATRWTSNLEDLRAITVRQPWAWLIVNGFKDIENRSKRIRYRGSLLIHAGLSRDDLDQNVKWVLKKYRISVPNELERGGIVGVVEVIDCVESHKSKWFEKGSFGWVLANPRRLKFRPCKGALNFFRPRFLTLNVRE
jgi:ASCH domain